MFRLHVYYPGAQSPDAIHEAGRAGEVLDLIPRLLQQHPACQRVVVFNGYTRLFAVDCQGNDLSD